MRLRSSQHACKEKGIHFDRNVFDVIPASLQNKEKPQKSFRNLSTTLVHASIPAFDIREGNLRGASPDSSVEHMLLGKTVDSCNICILWSEKIMKGFFYTRHCLKSFCKKWGEVNFRFLCFPLLLTPNLVRTLHGIQSIPRIRINSFVRQIFWVRFIWTGGI